jgi:transposase-like protein
MLKEHRAPQTLSEAIKYFADPDVALAFVVQLRWPAGVVCPYCKGERPSFLTTRRIWKCRECKKQFSVKVGTIFEDSALGLDKWLPALWMLANCKNGISSYELAASLGVTQKTAWFMLSRIRLAMQTKTFTKRMGGRGRHIEADETFVGGKRKWMHKNKRPSVHASRGKTDKETVLGMLERKVGKGHSTIRLAHVRGHKKTDVRPQIEKHVEQGSHLFTDALPSYSRLAQREWRKQYKHASVDHAIAYVDGVVHTNGLENFWSLLKRSIKGTYVSVDPVHLFRYLDEQAYRFNNREDSPLSRFVGVLKDVVGKRLTYNELTTSDLLPATT